LVDVIVAARDAELGPETVRKLGAKKQQTAVTSAAAQSDRIKAATIIPE
jgi:hypothetical protein